MRLAGFLVHSLAVNAQLIWAMSRHELHIRFAGTIGGFFWGVVNPIVTLCVYWVVFEHFFHLQSEEGYPLAVFLTCAFIPWASFAEMVSGACQAVASKPYLVSKTVFPTEILPVISVISAALLHLLLLAVVAIVYAFGFGLFSWYYLQSAYYILCLCVLATGIGFVVSALNVLFRDVGQIVSVVLNIWFWLTPVVWSPEVLPARFRFYVSLNPMYYIVEGYRDSFIRGVPFWEAPTNALAFWAITLTIFSIGSYVFLKLKSEFAEML